MKPTEIPRKIDTLLLLAERQRNVWVYIMSINFGIVGLHAAWLYSEHVDEYVDYMYSYMIAYQRVSNVYTF